MNNEIFRDALAELRPVLEVLQAKKASYKVLDYVSGFEKTLLTDLPEDAMLSNAVVCGRAPLSSHFWPLLAILLTKTRVYAK
jgi:hypothetical protein